MDANKPTPAFHCVGEWDDCKKHRGAGHGCPHVNVCREKTGGIIDAEEANAALVMVKQLKGRSA